MNITVTHDDPRNDNVLIAVPDGKKSAMVYIMPLQSHTFFNVRQVAVKEGHNYMEKPDEE